MRTVEAETLGYNDSLWWVLIPTENGRSKVGLTLPREQLRHGFAQYRFLQVEVDYATLVNDGRGYTADLVIKDGIERPVDTTIE